MCKFLWNANVPGTSAEAIVDAEAVNVFLGETCDACMPKGTYRGGKKPAYWWTKEIAELRTECLQARRRYKRGRTRAIPVDGQGTKNASKNVGKNSK